MYEDIKPHLVELRRRIFISVMALIVSFIVSFIMYKPILYWVTKPLENALVAAKKVVHKDSLGQWKLGQKDKNGTIKFKESNVSVAQIAINKANSVINSKNATKTEIDLANSIKALATAMIEQQKKEEANSFWGSITTRQVGGVFMVALKVSLYASLFLALPIILWQMWLFIEPALYDNEKRLAFPFLIGVTVMFIVGVLFAYYVVAPFGFQFLITFGAFLYTPIINIEDYISFFAKIMLGFGIAFELPMIVYFLALIGVVTDKTLKDYFRYAIVIIFIIAAILTPPDVITQMLMAAPLILLYGASILVAKAINPYKEEDE